MGRFKTTKTRSKPNRNKLLKINSDNNIKYYDKKKQNSNKKITGSTRKEEIRLNEKSRSDDFSEETDNLD